MASGRWLPGTRLMRSDHKCLGWVVRDSELSFVPSPQCPNLPMQIAGAKRIQQELAMPGVTEVRCGWSDDDRGG